MNEPQVLTIEGAFKHLMTQGQAGNNIFYEKGYGVIVDAKNFFTPFVARNTPFSIDDYRMGLVKRGKLCVMVNLKELEVSAGTLIFVTPGTIGEPLWCSDDFEIDGLGFPADLFRLAHYDHLPELFNGQRRDGQLVLANEEVELVDSLFHTLFRIVKSKPMSMSTTLAMVSTITNLYQHLFSIHAGDVSVPDSYPSVFDRFIALVNKHYREQHQLSFYADKMCMSERYLSTLVRQQSGKTAKEWIDRAIITTAKVMLRHGNHTLVEITEALNFTNVSFFCKYFKRLAGMTPGEYRNE